MQSPVRSLVAVRISFSPSVVLVLWCSLPIVNPSAPYRRPCTFFRWQRLRVSRPRRTFSFLLTGNFDVLTLDHMKSLKWIILSSPMFTACSFADVISFTVQVLSQRNLLRNWTRTRAYKYDVQRFPKQLLPLRDLSAAGALDGEELLPIELLVCGTTPAGALDGEELLPIELQCETTPAGALDHKELLHVELEVEAASPSCKTVASKSAGSSASPTPPFRRVRLRYQRHRS